ncbi:MAG TPA: glycosyltransferase family 39 protein [Candidatus Desulfobacillus sp.]|nr:glycosyltransferase family 39 protein [Candidatus Desulfobacillus sp.]
MPPPRLPITFPPRGIALTALCALYLLAGLVGHDPWKNEDATHFGVAFSMIEGGGWLVPRLAGEAWLESPPLYYWVAALLGKAFAAFLPVHDGARLASGLFVGLMLACLAGTARLLAGREAARGAALVGIGVLGLLVHAHESQPATALLAATAALYLGLALSTRHAAGGGALAGIALAGGFLAAGLQALLALAPLLLLLPFLGPQPRAGRAGRALLAALLVAAPLILAWPMALQRHDPTLFARWWSLELAGLQPQDGWLQALWAWLKLLGWFAWPALPLALWTLWKERRRLAAAHILLPLASFLALLLAQTAFYGPRSLNALPLLPPLILLAAPATLSLRRGAANAFDWFGMMTFSLLAGLIWLGWLAMVAGTPAQIAKNFSRLEPGFVARFSMPAFAAALALTLAWLWLIFASPRAPQRGAAHWAAGVTLCWSLLVALWTPWIDHGRSYRPVFAGLKAALPAVQTCISGQGLSSPQRASLHYFAGIVLQPEGSRASAACRLYLVQGTARNPRLPPGKGWRKIWEDHRPSDRNERFQLYFRP